MTKEIFKIGFLLLMALPLLMVSCVDDDNMQPISDPGMMTDTTMMDPDTMVTVEANIMNLLINQVSETIIPSSEEYQREMNDFLAVAESFVGNPSETSLTSLRNAYLEANLAYQAIAVHDYYANQNVDLVKATNLYPIDTALLSDFIENETYNFNTTAQQRATGFPALDFLLYGSEDVVAQFSGQPERGAFLVALVTAMRDKADALVARWTGSLRDNFINNGGVQLGSSVSVQLNESLVYYEIHIRGNKVGIPIGRLGPNDTPFDPDPAKVEGYYQSLREGDGAISLALLRAAIEEMEDIYLGTTSGGENGIGYDDLVLNTDQGDVIDADIKAQYQDIYDRIDGRSGILGDENLYNSIQALVTLYKSDLFPVLNVQDADGSNDGD